jgi:hypothetical protein
MNTLPCLLAFIAAISLLVTHASAASCFCVQVTDENGYMWDTTTCGSSVVRTCKSGYGTASRACVNSQWWTTDSSQCLDAEIASLALQMITSSNVANTTVTLSRFIFTKKTNLGGIDIDNSNTIISNAIATLSSVDDNTMFDVANNIVNAVSEMQNVLQSSFMATESSAPSSAIIRTSIALTGSIQNFQPSPFQQAVAEILGVASATVAVTAFGAVDTSFVINFKVV